MSTTPPLVETEWLSARLGAEGVRVLDASWRMPGAGNARDEHRLRHIPGAAFFDIDSIADQATPLPHMLPPAADFAAKVRALGVRSEDYVVVYDDAGLFSAARVWWSFRAMGHDRVSVLNGGLPKWIEEGRPVESGELRSPVGNFDATLKCEHVANAAAVRAALVDRGPLVLDARSEGRFSGRENEPRAGLRRGAMPGAQNLPFARLLDKGFLRERDALRIELERLGWRPGRKVIATCGSGVTAAIIALALAALGEEAAVYDGSWAEWGRAEADPELFPVVVRDGA